MAVRVLVIGDCHFKPDNIRDTDLMVKAVLDQVIKHHPDFVVMLGDTLHTHEKIHVTPLNRALDFLEALAALAPTYLLIGNHDLLNNSQFHSNQHPFNGLKKWSNLKVIDQTYTLRIKDLIFTFSPYVPPGDFLNSLNKEIVVSSISETTKSRDEEKLMTWPKARAIFCHQEFRGAKMGAIISVAGDYWAPDQPLVISGHVHDYDQLQHNLLYVGTPIQHGFGDSSRKTISLITFPINDLNADSKTLYTESRIDLKVPRKLTVTLKAEDIESYTPPDNTELRIEICCETNVLKSLNKLKKIKDWTNAGIKIVYRPVGESTKAVNENSEQKMIGSQQSFPAILYAHCNTNGEMKDLFIELFGEVKASREMKVPLPVVTLRVNSETTNLVASNVAPKPLIEAPKPLTGPRLKPSIEAVKPLTGLILKPPIEAVKPLIEVPKALTGPTIKLMIRKF